MTRSLSICISLLAVGCFISPRSPAHAQSLEQQLLAQPPGELATEALQEGDPERGAVAFHSQRLGCAKCHVVGGSRDAASLSVGPDLARVSRPTNDAHFVQSVLRPSLEIDAKYRSLQVLTDDGAILQGLPLHDDDSRLVLRTGVSDSDLVELDPATIATRRTSNVSLMPTGQVNGLRNRLEFLDLVAYLIAVADGGPDVARRLEPSEAETRLVLPKYENRVDHAELIAAWDDEAFDRGRNIYRGLCINCHGTVTAAGSLPTAPRFATDKLKRGSDPYTMYQTLTHGSGMMVPQTWMVPQQKYDVIYYIREHFFHGHNPELLTPLSEEYLESLPKGDTRGPKPQRIEPWRDMDYGSMLMATLEFGEDGSNIAQKGIAVRLDEGPGGVAEGSAWIAFEHDTLRVAGIWSGSEFIDWHGILFDGRHGKHPRVEGSVHLQNPTGPGWANPETDSFDDTARVEGRDGRRYGPLPAEWAKYRGLHRYGRDVVLHYTVGDTECLEMPGMSKRSNDEATIPFFTRTLNVGPRKHDLRMLVATLPGAQRLQYAGADAGRTVAVICETSGKPTSELIASAAGADGAISWQLDEDRLCLKIAAGDKPLQFAVSLVDVQRPAAASLQDLTEPLLAAAHDATGHLMPRTGGGPATWPMELPSRAATTHQSDAWQIQEIVRPAGNPWQARVRVTGFDFLDPDTLAVCTWDGDVWIVRGIATGQSAEHNVTWRRIAAGLFQPLGLLVVDGQIMLTCRDQLVRLEDRNRDGEADYYACFNSDHQVTEHFHEFAMGLQRDDAGNFYYAKSARHALSAVVPHHGTLLRVSPDGSETEILAVGFRAANGVCLNDDGSFIVTDQEGHWNPKNRINWVREGGFYGNMYGYHAITDSSDDAMRKPLCWITNEFDRSPAELLWVPDDAWGPLAGSLLNLSYGYGRLHVVPHEHRGPTVQGAMCPLPLPDFPTGLIRGRFDPAHEYLYAGGLFAWAGSRQDQDGGLFRIAYRGGNTNLPIGISAHGDQVELKFSDELDPDAAGDASRYEFRTWSLRRTENYGSEHYDERNLEVSKAHLGSDQRTVTLTMSDLEPNWCFSIRCELVDAEGKAFERELHGTIHTLE